VYFLKVTRYLLAALVGLSALPGCQQLASDTQPATVDSKAAPTSLENSSWQAVEQIPPGLSALTPFSGSTGQVYDWPQLLSVLEAADVIVFGESHTDARGHAIQTELIAIILQRWDKATLSLEEFDRSQQEALDAFQRGELTAADINSIGVFVMPAVRNNWVAWYLPKLEAASLAGAPLLASNAPMKYSRMVRNVGCDDLPDLDVTEQSLFDCPAAAEDPAYKARFVENLTAAISRNKPAGLKPLEAEQTDRMFRSQRVWDATMAGSIAQARAAGTEKVLHVVGNVHSDFNGGFIQELQYRDPDARLLVISLVPKRSSRLLGSDRGRADIVIYTR